MMSLEYIGCNIVVKDMFGNERLKVSEPSWGISGIISIMSLISN